MKDARIHDHDVRRDHDHGKPAHGGILPARKPLNRSADYLRRTRIKLGLSRNQAAALAGCTAQTIGRYERRGISGNMRYSRIDRLCHAYGISADHLLSLMMQPAE